MKRSLITKDLQNKPNRDWWKDGDAKRAGLAPTLDGEDSRRLSQLWGFPLRSIGSKAHAGILSLGHRSWEEVPT